MPTYITAISGLNLGFLAPKEALFSSCDSPSWRRQVKGTPLFMAPEAFCVVNISIQN